MYHQLINKETKLAVIGLGYVGLPIALEFARKIKVIGFDIKPERINMLNKHIDPSNEIEKSAFENTDILFTANPDDLKEASFFIVTVPTPIDSHNLPDLTPVFMASKTVGKVLSKGDYVVYESTVYPGATEEDCVPILERESGLTYGKDFKVGYSPERINPGDKEHTLTKITKVVSGCDKEALDVIGSVYGIVVKANIFKASNIKTAEAAKVIENTQRDVNIALMNELSIIFSRLGINTFDVLEAAGTKWNFLKFSPGLVGGHCIGVDPYYLSYKAKEYGYYPQIIDAGRFVNDSMGRYIAKQTVKRLLQKKISLLEARILIMGFTFKENVTDIRNTRIIDIYNELKSYNLCVDVTDAQAEPEDVKAEYGIDMITEINDQYDAIILAVNHKEYLNLTEDYFKTLGKDNVLLVDVKGTYRNKIKSLDYFSL
ncbi:MAG TPA: nucleotide sugar dehydrogenase [Bacteroidales bacterium]|nr:nucleotide sugar dehydrogenase [Bacteroidales bacterium]